MTFEAHAEAAAARPLGPGSSFHCLLAEPPETGLSLPPSFREIYAGEWSLPELRDRPYVYANFAIARDGRVSFAEHGRSSGGDITDWNPNDRWLMALLRARADAVVVGDGTLAVEPEIVWTAEDVWPADAAAFAALRVSERRATHPTQVILSLHGKLPEARIFQEQDLDIIIATTMHGARAARDTAAGAGVEVFELGTETVDVPRLLTALREARGVTTVLSEGGPRVYGSLLRAGAVDDEFLTVCPKVLGDSSAREPRRPSLVEGVAFSPDDTPRSRLLSVRRAGDYLFLRSRYQ